MLGEESKFLGRGKACAAAGLRAFEGRDLISASVMQHGAWHTQALGKFLLTQ